MAVKTLPTAVALSKLKLPDVKVNREVESAFRELAKARDFTVQDVTITTSATRIAHLLGRTMTGWQILDTNADARIWRVEGPANDPEDVSSHFFLQASATVTIRLKVF